MRQLDNQEGPQMQQPQTPFSKPADKRDTNGNPQGLKRLKEGFRKRFGSPFVRVTENAEQVTVGDVDQSQRINELLPWFVILSLVAGAALALAIDDRASRSEQRAARTQELEWAMRTAKAEMRAETAQAVAKAQADAASAATISEVWRNRVNKLEAEINANRRR